MIEHTTWRGYGENKHEFRKFDKSEGVESNDDRHLYLKAIRKDKNINSYYIGMFKGDGFSADKNFQKCLFQIQTPQRMKFANLLQ